MSDWEDLYSEVRRRKMEAPGKKKIVKAVEKHAGLLFLDGKYEKAGDIFNFIYAKEKVLVEEVDLDSIIDFDLSKFDLIVIGCPGTGIPDRALPKIRQFVWNGGYLICTDWCIKSICEKVFPGYIEAGEQRTDDTVVPCTILKPNHPFVEGVSEALQRSKKDEFKWWLDYRSFPIKILNKRDVKVLIASWELKERWGEAPVLVYFYFGEGAVIHMISHTVLQKGEREDKFVSALIITNILDEKISQTLGGPSTQKKKYLPDSESKAIQKKKALGALEEQWVRPPEKVEQQQQQQSPAPSSTSLSGVAKIIEANPSAINPSELCVYCLYDFVDYDAKIFQCKECGHYYHDNCLTRQLDQGVCKHCDRILLW